MGFISALSDVMAAVFDIDPKHIGLEQARGAARTLKDPARAPL
jgi:hypothetical protein